MITEPIVHFVLTKAFIIPGFIEKIKRNALKTTFNHGDYLYDITFFVKCTYSLRISKVKNVNKDDVTYTNYILFNIEEDNTFTIRYFSTNMMKDNDNIFHISKDGIKTLKIGSRPTKEERRQLAYKIFTPMSSI